MNPFIKIEIVNGQIQIQGPMDNLPLCLHLLGQGMEALAQLTAQRQQNQQAAKPALFLPDGSAVPPALLNRGVNGSLSNGHSE